MLRNNREFVLDLLRCVSVGGLRENGASERCAMF